VSSSTGCPSKVIDFWPDKPGKQDLLPKMAHLPFECIEGFIKAEPPKICYFLRTPLEIRNQIYRMLLTTPYCTRRCPNETSLEFQLSMNLLRANKQIYEEATRVFLQKNHFIILKVVGLSKLRLEDVPVFRFLAEEKVANPVLRVEIKSVHEGRHHDASSTLTLITTPVGLSPVITALWKLDQSGQNFDSSPSIIVPCYPSDLSLSLSFNVRPLVACDLLKNFVLTIWTLLHGIKGLVLAGDVGDSLSQLLRKSMLEGPFTTEVFSTLRKYHVLGQRAMMKKDYVIARWWWTAYEDYCRHFDHLRLDRSRRHEMQDPNDNLWAGMWIQAEKMYLQGRLGTARTYLHEARYREALLTILKTRRKRVFSFYIRNTMNPVFHAKFCLCEAFTHIALGDIEEGLNCLKSAATFFHNSALGTRSVSTTSERPRILGMWLLTLEDSINTELIKLNLPYRCNWLPNLKSKADIARLADITRLAGLENRTFWEWLDIPEE
jgi:hypothetical protein